MCIPALEIATICPHSREPVKSLIPGNLHSPQTMCSIFQIDTVEEKAIIFDMFCWVSSILHCGLRTIISMRWQYGLQVCEYLKQCQMNRLVNDGGGGGGYAANNVQIM